MFKKLFISLIILSALTSEGVVVSQKDYYDLLLYAQNESGMLSDSDIALALNTEVYDKNFTFSYNEPLSFSSLKPACNKEPYRYKNSFKNFDKPSYKGYLPSAFLCPVCDEYSYIKGREPVVEGTDSSPPFYKI